MELEEQISLFKATYESIFDEVSKMIVGQQDVIEGVLISVLAGGHTLLEGVPGLGKTLLVRTLARTLDLKFSRIQFTPDLMPSDIVGTNMIMEDSHGSRAFEFQAGPVFANILLADEINRATPKTQSALLEAMQEGSVTVSGVIRKLEDPFFVLATQNPIEMEGTYPLPEAQLDRFIFKIQVTSPSLEELASIVERTTGTKRPEIHPITDGSTLLSMRRLAREVPVASHVRDYALKLVLATHPDSEHSTEEVRHYARFGGSPRAAQTLILAGKIRALLQGRYNVAYEDIKAAALPALRHRVILNFEGEAEGITTDHLISGILDTAEKQMVSV